MLFLSTLHQNRFLFLFTLLTINITYKLPLTFLIIKLYSVKPLKYINSVMVEVEILDSYKINYFSVIYQHRRISTPIFWNTDSS